MKLSVCIPQHNRCAHLINALESLRGQTYGDLEVVVSDDCSTDDSQERVPRYLAASGLRYTYVEQPRNIGYDANLRAALGAASGDFLFIMGNDDAIPEPDTLGQVAALLDEFRPDLAIGNVVDVASGGLNRRVTRTECTAGTPDGALRMFRALSCVTGLIFSREAFLRHNTSRYDRSIYVQMYLGSSVIASGGRLLTMDIPVAKMGTLVAGKYANSYRDTLPKYRRKILPLTGGLDEAGRVVCEAIWPYVPAAERSRITRVVFSQLLMSSYAYWLYNYRQNGAPWAAFNLALGCVPPRLVRGTHADIGTVALLGLPYLGATSSLLLPLPILDSLKDVARAYMMRNR
jgi:glycosyltransferase involved in cell wall biosynthesis